MRVRKNHLYAEVLALAARVIPVRCRRCNHRLTRPESRKRELGPVCNCKVGGA